MRIRASAFQFQKPSFLLDARGISPHFPAARDHPVAGNQQGRGIPAVCLTYGAGCSGHPDPGRHPAVGPGAAAGNPAHFPPDGLLEAGARGPRWGMEGLQASGEVLIEFPEEPADDRPSPGKLHGAVTPKDFSVQFVSGGRAGHHDPQHCVGVGNGPDSAERREERVHETASCRVGGVHRGLGSDHLGLRIMEDCFPGLPCRRGLCSRVSEAPRESKAKVLLTGVQESFKPVFPVRFVHDCLLRNLPPGSVDPAGAIPYYCGHGAHRLHRQGYHRPETKASRSRMGARP